jgi:hypothetical protein
MNGNDAMTPVAVAVPKSSPQTPPKVPVPVPAKTWKDLHRATCLRQHSFLATAAQVQATSTVTHNDGMDLPVRTSVLLGKDPDLQQKLIQKFQAHEQSFASPRKGSAAAASSMTPSAKNSLWYTAAATTYAVASTTAHVLTSPIRLANRLALSQIADGDGDGYDDVPEGWEEEELANKLAQESSAHSVSIESVIDIHDNVFNVDLALECLRLLQNAATHSPNRVLRLERSSSTSLTSNNHSNNKEYFWHDWLQEVSATAAPSDATNLLKHQLPESQTDLLLNCLVAANSDRFQIVRREHACDVVVFGTHKKNDKQKSSLQTQLTLHDLEYAVSQVQERIEMTLDKRDISTKRALAAKTSKNNKLAVAEMKRRKLYDHTLDQAYATLEKLEQVRMTVQAAVHQRDELSMLRQATDALKLIHVDTSLEQVDDVLDDYLEEQEHVKYVSDTLAASMMPAGLDSNGDDDEALMKELEALTLGDQNDDEMMKELEALTLGDSNKEEPKVEIEASARSPAKEVSKSGQEETETPEPETSSSSTPVAL